MVIEAGDLKKSSPLRTLCERAKNAVALPCYADGERDLARLVDDEMKQAGLTIAPDARAALVPFLGGDRAASRNEIRKLALYAQKSGQVTLDDVMAVVADASALALDNVVDAAFAGKTAEVEAQYGKARLAGTAPGTIASAALRQVSNLHRLRLSVDEGSSVSEAVARARPPVHFRRQAIIETALAQLDERKAPARHGAIVGRGVRDPQAARAGRSHRASRADRDRRERAAEEFVARSSW